jgi:hypothetical protein
LPSKETSTSTGMLASFRRLTTDIVDVGTGDGGPASVGAGVTTGSVGDGRASTSMRGALISVARRVMAGEGLGVVGGGEASAALIAEGNTGPGGGVGPAAGFFGVVLGRPGADRIETCAGSTGSERGAGYTAGGRCENAVEYAGGGGSATGSRGGETATVPFDAEGEPEARPTQYPATPISSAPASAAHASGKCGGMVRGRRAAIVRSKLPPMAIVRSPADFVPTGTKSRLPHAQQLGSDSRLGVSQSAHCLRVTWVILASW